MFCKNYVSINLYKLILESVIWTMCLKLAEAWFCTVWSSLCILLWNMHSVNWLKAEQIVDILCSSFKRVVDCLIPILQFTSITQRSFHISCFHRWTVLSMFGFLSMNYCVRSGFLRRNTQKVCCWHENKRPITASSSRRQSQALIFASSNEHFRTSDTQWF